MLSNPNVNRKNGVDYKKIVYGLVARIRHLKCSSVNLALIRSPAQKVGLRLVVQLQIMQQLTTLVTFFKSEDRSHKSIGIEFC